VRLLLQTGSAHAGEWRAAFAAALPEAEVTLWPEVPASVDYLAVWKPPAELFARVPAPRAIFNLGAGVDSLLRLPTLPADVPIVRLEDAGMAAQMIDYVTLAVLAVFREQAAYAQQQRAALWQPRPPLSRRDFGVGVLGFGVLGRAVAAALLRFGFPLACWSRTRGEMAGVDAFAGADELPAFLARSRVLVCLLPSTPSTRGILDRARLSALPRGAHLVNVARGDIVVEADLLAALDAGALAGATLDVFHDEPLPPAHPFWHHPRITVTPHVSAVTLVDESVAQVAAAIRRLEQRLPIRGIVDRTRGY
jgi:glyoxylate/hydroxypyruvate reductase A